MKKQFIYIALFIAIVHCSACGYDNCGPSEGLRIATIGMTPSQIDTIILRKFARGSGFTNRIDTVLIDSTKAYFQFPYTTKDTSFMGILSEQTLLKSQYDYEIFIPSVNRLVRVSDINEPQQRMKKTFPSTKTYCINNIQSFQQDGSLVTLKAFAQQQVYIRP
jgi:hypothetical protein